MGREPASVHVVVVGGGFAGLACTRRLADDRRVRVTLVDRNDYHQFQPLLYQVASAQLAPRDVAAPLGQLLRHHHRVQVVRAEVASVDPAARALATAGGERIAGDVLVLAAGFQAGFAGVPGAREHALPLYTLDDATRLRARLFAMLDAAAASGAGSGDLAMVVVGGGATGVETAGALADMLRGPVRAEYPGLPTEAARVVLVGHGRSLLRGFSERAQRYAAEALERKGVMLRLGAGVQEVAPAHVVLADGTRIGAPCVVWAAGCTAADVAAACGLPLGHGGRVDVRPDLTVPGFPGVFAAGDVANMPGPDGRPLPQLGAVALQAGRWAGDNVVRTLDGDDPQPFRYHDKGMMAMVGRGAAVAEVGHGRHVVHGRPAFAAWLALHAALMSGVRNRADAFVEWAWDALAPSHNLKAFHRSDRGRIAWGEDDAPSPKDEADGGSGDGAGG